MKLTFCFILSMLVSNLYAQDTAFAKKYEEKTLFLHGSRYLLDGQKVPNSSLRVLLTRFPDSKFEFKASRKYTTIARALNAASLGMYVYGISQVDENHRRFTNFLIGSLITHYVSIPFNRAGKKHLHKSIWLYNRDALSR